MLKVNNEKELINLLKIIADESISKAKKSLYENNDITQNKYMQGLKNDEQFYNVSLSEQEGVEEEEEEAPEEDEDATESDEKEKSEEPSPEELDPENFGVSFDGVLKTINNLRAGRSTKDKEIKDELLGYYDKLDEEERKILYLFLRELSKILQGALDGTDAIDPSDPPFNMDVITKDAEGEASSGEPQQSTGSNRQPQSTQQQSSGEDTSPPIKVNERQELNEIRRKVKRLMKRF